MAKEEVISPDMDAPPALPPKISKQWRSSVSAVPQTSEIIDTGEKTITLSSTTKNEVKTASSVTHTDQQNRMLPFLNSGDELTSTVREEELQSTCAFVDEGISSDKLNKLETVAVTPLKNEQLAAETTSLVISAENEEEAKKVRNNFVST